MPEIPDICEFKANADQVRLTTQTNGDVIHIKGVHLDSNQAASLAHLVNRTAGHALRIEIKEQ